MAGAYKGDVPTGATDFASGFKAIPGAKVTVKERHDGRGYRIEARLPLAFLLELSAARLQEFERTNAKNHFGTVKESRADLSGPIRFNAALLLGDPDSLTRLP